MRQFTPANRADLRHHRFRGVEGILVKRLAVAGFSVASWSRGWGKYAHDQDYIT